MRFDELIIEAMLLMNEGTIPDHSETKIIFRLRQWKNVLLALRIKTIDNVCVGHMG